MSLPQAYIDRERGFWRDIFYVDENVLIPQPDTETVVEQAFETLKKSAKKTLDILDLCAGSGCIGISLAKELSKKGFKVNLTLSDISHGAYEVFSKNCECLLKGFDVNVRKVIADMFNGVKGLKFDCIVTNPPYIRTDIIPTLSSDVKAEPLIALDGGKDGLDFYRTINREYRNHINDGGFLFMEIGYDQAKDVTRIFAETASCVEIFQDLGRRDRVVKASV